MDRAEKIMLILKAMFHNNDDLLNKIDAIAQLKRPEILLNHDEKVYFDEFTEDWFNLLLVSC